MSTSVQTALAPEPHAVRPPGHDAPHTLFTHVAVPPAGGGQTRPQLAQFIGSLRTSTSQPSAAIALQFAKPARHDPMPHVPAEHPAFAFGGAVQTLPHVPQFVIELPVSVSHPLAALESQFE